MALRPSAVPRVDLSKLPNGETPIALEKDPVDFVKEDGSDTYLPLASVAKLINKVRKSLLRPTAEGDFLRAAYFPIINCWAKSNATPLDAKAQDGIVRTYITYGWNDFSVLQEKDWTNKAYGSTFRQYKEKRQMSFIDKELCEAYDALARKQSPSKDEAELRDNLEFAIVITIFHEVGHAFNTWINKGDLEKNNDDTPRNLSLKACVPGIPASELTTEGEAGEVVEFHLVGGRINLASETEDVGKYEIGEMNTLYRIEHVGGKYTGARYLLNDPAINALLKGEYFDFHHFDFDEAKKQVFLLAYDDPEANKALQARREAEDKAKQSMDLVIKELLCSQKKTPRFNKVKVVMPDSVQKNIKK